LAIGGISLERLPAVVACGVNGVAVVSAVTQALDPQRACIAGLRAFPR
jgi:thiamine monophosphate synthase